MIAVRLPAELVANSEFVVTGTLAGKNTGEGSVQLEVLKQRPERATACFLPERQSQTPRGCGPPTIRPSPSHCLLLQGKELQRESGWSRLSKSSAEFSPPRSATRKSSRSMKS